MVQNMHCRVHCSGFGIVGSVYQGSDAGVHHGPCAHGAWLNGDEKIAVIQAVIADFRSGFAQCHNFCMGGWIGVGQIAIESATDDFAFMHHDCADRNLAYVERSLSSAQGLLHP
jgi:hypothetical protein